MDVTNYTDKAVELVMTYGPKLVLAILVLIFGLWLINIVIRLFVKNMEKRGVDPSEPSGNICGTALLMKMA